MLAIWPRFFHCLIRSGFSWMPVSSVMILHAGPMVKLLVFSRSFAWSIWLPVSSRRGGFSIRSSFFIAAKTVSIQVTPSGMSSYSVVQVMHFSAC